MRYLEKIKLDSKEVKQARQLAKVIHEHDKTFCDIYLSNQYNYFKDMPTFILAYDNEELIGLTMLYADEKPDEEVDIHVEVSPKKRQQGVATEMIKRAKKILNKYGYQNYDFVSEKAFIEQNPTYLSNNNLKVDATDYHMSTQNPEKIFQDDKLNRILGVRQMVKTDFNNVASIYSVAFDIDIANAETYIAESLADDQMLSFVLTYKEDVIGYCAVDDGYFFGLFVARDYQGHGYASFFIKKMMELLLRKGINEFSLDVELDNIAAVRTYQNAGLKIVSETYYLVKEK